MMPVVRLNDATFGALATISAWYGTKTPVETLDRIVRETMEQLGLERDDETEEAVVTEGAAMEFNSAPGLAFTKPLSASVGGKQIRSPRWSGILTSMIAAVKSKGFEGEKLKHELNVNSHVGKFEDEGFKYYPDLGISVQGQSATDAWKEIERLANKHRIQVAVEFWWRQNPKAQYPGKTGKIRAGA